MQEIIQTSLTITAFVMLMMLVIEYINVQTKGKWDQPLRKKRWLQIIVAALLGAIPGCLGVYTVVSLFTHKVVSFGALVSAMIATSGDEAFVMFAMIPKQALWISLIILALAIVTGFVVNVFFKNVSFGKQHDHQFDIHQSEVKCAHKNEHKIVDNIKKMSFTRGFILTGLLLFMAFLFTGVDLHNHSFSLNKVIFSEASAMQDGKLVEPINEDIDLHHDCSKHNHHQAHNHTEEHSHTETQESQLHDILDDMLAEEAEYMQIDDSEHVHTHECESHEHHQHEANPANSDNHSIHSHDSHEGHHHHHGEEPPFNLPKTIFVLLSLFSIFIVLAVPNHFIEEHIWNHVIKKHFLKIFLWTFGTLVFIYYANYFSQEYFQFDMMSFAKNNLWLILIFAILIGILPESGPHMVFISLFATGVIPISILMANSIVQDGHGSLPLLAENKKAFFHMKWINMLVGLIVGSLGIFFGF
jgi:hypothetical protein